VLPGDSSTITSIANSPQNRTLSYSYSASAGQIASNTPTVTLNTAGAPRGTISVTCNVVDDLGKEATANTSVTVTAPPTPVATQTRNLLRAQQKRPVRADNKAKGCLDEVALTLIRNTTSKLVIIGKHLRTKHPMPLHNATSTSRSISHKRKASTPRESKCGLAVSSISQS
jgi:hypothetical protein